MADITMCANDKCTIRMSCRRFVATPNEFRQSYAEFKQKHDGTCSYHWLWCKHVIREGESCRLNNNCKYPNCNNDERTRNDL